MKGRDMMPDAVWIHPEDSFCVEIKCMELVKSVDWPGGCTMRYGDPIFTYSLEQKIALCFGGRLFAVSSCS